ncbi:hypothetical protein FNW02_25470 [Komarekiella sp. 'clone 1']|uniref:Uncharacterized protein n=1 Tax=Komarekiella delphini-convector SJRDD-AB1 TaxID=2593771 RepID=A0AA40VTD2_9NOST|nr:hypothetical protein [Komarekiella delphini-convector]MBD6619080.1 hypothetical protein [Komarekiella delphini-convector SJRDD-AB1]
MNATRSVGKMYCALTQMLQSNCPPLEITTESLEEPWYKRVLQLTKTEHALVQGEANWLEVSSSDRWVGGIRLTRGQPVWIWDDLRNQTILQ